MSSKDNNEESQQVTQTKPDDQAAAAELDTALEELINTISNKFAGLSSEIFAKMDEMSRRLDKLEANLMADKEKENAPKPS